VLRRKVMPVKEVSDRHRALLSEMARVMYDAKGIGLAAPQVGISESMIVVDTGTGLYKLVNVKVTKKEGRQCMEEGCLSVPGVGVKVKRAKKVMVEALDETGKAVCFPAEDLLACVFQHECDHLEGKLIVDYASLIGKIKIKKTVTRFLKKAHDGTAFPPKGKFGAL